jgi:hypothetical protein
MDSHFTKTLYCDRIVSKLSKDAHEEAYDVLRDTPLNGVDKPEPLP